MINLLPPNEKKELFLEKKRRLFVALGAVVIISLFSLILILFSVKTYIKGQIEDQGFFLEQTKKEHEKSDIKDFQEIIKKYNKTLTGLKKFYGEKVYWNEILERVSKIERAGIYFTNLSCNKEEKANEIKVTVTGFSNTRENLSSFKENLEKEKSFTNIYFSPVSWTKSVDVDFYLTFIAR